MTENEDPLREYEELSRLDHQAPTSIKDTHLDFSARSRTVNYNGHNFEYLCWKDKSGNPCGPFSVQRVTAGPLTLPRPGELLTFINQISLKTGIGKWVLIDDRIENPSFIDIQLHYRKDGALTIHAGHVTEINGHDHHAGAIKLMKLYTNQRIEELAIEYFTDRIRLERYETKSKSWLKRIFGKKER